MVDCSDCGFYSKKGCLNLGTCKRLDPTKDPIPEIYKYIPLHVHAPLILNSAILGGDISSDPHKDEIMDSEELLPNRIQKYLSKKELK